MYEKQIIVVFRTCSWATCGCRVTMIARRPICSAMPSSTPGRIRAISLPIRRVGHAMIAPGSGKRSPMCNPVIVWSSGNWTVSAVHCRICSGLSRPSGLGVACLLTEQMDTTTPQGVLFSGLGPGAHEQALTQEQVRATRAPSRTNGGQQMDTTTPQGAFLFSVFGALAQYERALTQERVRAGLAAAQRRGKRGGPRGPFHRPRLSGLAIACTAVVWSRRRRAAVSLEGRRWVWTKARRISPKRAKV